MRMPPNYGRAYTERFAGMYKDWPSETKVPLVPFMLRRRGAGARRTSRPTACIRWPSAHPTILDNIWPQLAPLLAKSNNAMKYPAVLSFDDVLPSLDEFDTIIDARSESEFALDHIPGAINCPVLNDEERILVGTTYKQVSAFEAKKIGAPLVARNIARHIETLFADKPRDWKPLVYCWRGGNRSGSMAHILAKVGWPVVQLDGGYKAYRAYVSGRAGATAARCDFRVICGTTGSGKSRLLETLDRHRRPGARPRTAWRPTAARCWATCPASRSRARRCSRPASGTSCAASTRRGPCSSNRKARRSATCACRTPLMDAHARRRPASRCSCRGPNRVRLLMEDYQHFTADPAALNAPARPPGAAARPRQDRRLARDGQRRPHARAGRRSCWSSTTTRPTCARSTATSSQYAAGRGAGAAGHRARTTSCGGAAAARGLTEPRARGPYAATRKKPGRSREPGFLVTPVRDYSDLVAQVGRLDVHLGLGLVLQRLDVAVRSRHCRRRGAICSASCLRRSWSAGPAASPC